MANDAKFISADQELANSHVNILTIGHQGIPSGSEVSQVTGTGGEWPASLFHNWLQFAADRIAASADEVRTTVATNADALKQAAAALQSKDKMSAADLRKYDDALDANASAGPQATAAPITSAIIAGHNDKQSSAAGKL
jgi:hypothetical protein